MATRSSEKPVSLWRVSCATSTVHFPHAMLLVRRQRLDHLVDFTGYQMASRAFQHFSKMADEEEFVFSVTEDGFGNRCSAYEFRTANRGGQGIGNMDLRRSGSEDTTVVSSFLVNDSDQLVMVTDTRR